MIKMQIDGLYPTQEVFSGLEPIELISFLETIKESIEALGKSEVVAVRILSYFPSEDSKDAYQAQIVPGTRTYII